MKSPKTKLRQLQSRIGLEDVSPEAFIQFMHDTISCMPHYWQDASERNYLQGGSQRFDQETGKPLQTDSRYYIMNEHVRYFYDTLCQIAREKPEVFEFLRKSS